MGPADGRSRKQSHNLREKRLGGPSQAVSARSGVGRARFFGVGRRLAETHSHNGIPCIPPFISLHRKKAHVVHDIYPKFPLVGNPGRVHDPKFFDGFHKSLFAIYTVTSHSMEMDVRFGSRFQHNAYHTISNNLPPNLLSFKEIQSWGSLADILDGAVKAYADNQKIKEGVNGQKKARGPDNPGIVENFNLGEIVVKLHVLGEKDLATFLFVGTGGNDNQKDKLELLAGITLGQSKGAKRELIVSVHQYRGIPTKWYKTRQGTVYTKDKEAGEYTPQYVRETFTAVAKDKCDAVIEAFDNSVFQGKDGLRKAVALHAADYVGTGLDVPSSLKYAEICVMIVTSIKLFLALLFSSGK